jgi:hypothetical protein
MPLDGDSRSAWVMLDNLTGQESLVTIRRVTYAIKRMFQMIDDVDDHPNFKMPAGRKTYKKLLATGSFYQ